VIRLGCIRVIGLYSSNYSDKVGVWGSNYNDKVGVWGSNYTFRLYSNSSNYISRINTELNTALAPLTNYWMEQNTNNIYLNKSGNVGIGTNTPQNQLHIYNTPSSSVRLETTTTGTTSIEFQRGANNDVNVDYRIICESDLFQIQSQDATNLYTTTTSELIKLSTSQITIYKNTLINVRLGIGVTTIGTMHDLDVLGSGRISGGLTTNTKVVVGLIYANGGITIPTGQSLDLNGTSNISAITMSTSGLITGNGGITIATDKH
jgi:hypothetical protein